MGGETGRWEESQERQGDKRRDREMGGETGR